MKPFEPRALVIERDLPHPPEKVWRALTETALLDEWLLKSDFKPVVGHTFTFRTEPVGGWNGVVESEVLVVEPPRTLAYTWRPWAAATWQVTWTLTPTKTGTLVRMEQSGFTAEQKNEFGGANYGWQQFFRGLERVLGGMS